MSALRCSRARYRTRSEDESLRRTESFPIFGGSNKGFYHISLLYSHQNIVAWLSEVVQLGQPEVVTRVVSVRQVIRVSAQVTKELHQEKRFIEFGVDQILMLGNLAHDFRARGLA
jgi:hypothetical protein